MSAKRYHVSKNLCNVSVESGYYDITTGGKKFSPRYIRSDAVIPCEGDKEYTLSFVCPKEGTASGQRPDGFVHFWSNIGYISTEQAAIKERQTFTTPTGTTGITFSIGDGGEDNILPSDITNIMLNEGSTVLPYEPYGTIWEDCAEKVYIASEITEHTGSLPITINANGQPLLDYLISGNTVQTGTPTPENPIMPSECGERTENLFDYHATDGRTNNKYIDQTDGTEKTDSTYYISGFIPVQSNAVYTWAFRVGTGIVHGVPTVGFYDSSKNKISVASHVTSITSFNFTTPQDCVYIRASVYKVNEDLAMLTKGSTPPSAYIPYGYKLPITLGSTTTDIYLGEVQTTRRIKKLMLTGEEVWGNNSSVSTEDTAYFYSSVVPQGTYITESAICSHFEYKDVFSSNDNGFQFFSSQYGLRCRIIRTIAGTTTDFKAWLAQQYAAGTPVTVWYVLAEPETGIVNEQLMKIGDYADTVSMEQVGESIPTNNGSTVIDYNGSPEPSEMYIKYNSWSGWVDTTEEVQQNGAWVDTTEIE